MNGSMSGTGGSAARLSGASVRRRSRGWAMTAATSFLLLASALAGCTGPTADGAGHHAAVDNGLKKVWSLPPAGSGDAAIGSWMAGTVLVRAGSKDGVRGYNTSDGTEAYRVSPDPDRSVPCAMSTTLSPRGIGTVAFGSAAHPCTRLAGVDSRTGRILWSVPLAESRYDPDGLRTYVQGDVATVINANGPMGFDVTTGHRVWTYEPRGSDCGFYSWAATSGALLVDDYCVDASPHITLSAIDGRTGRRLWVRPEQAHVGIEQLLTANPLIGSLHESDGVRLERFDSRGGSTRISTVGLNENVSNGFPGNPDAGIVGQKMIAPTRSSSGLRTVTAFDPTTGAQLWTYAGASRTGATLVDASGDGRIYAVSAGSGSTPPHLVRLDPATGSPTVLSPLDSGTDDWTAVVGAVYALPGGGIVQLSALNDTAAAIAYR